MLLIIGGIIVFIILVSIKQIDQYERGVKFTLGKYSKMMQPGWNLVLPIFQSFRKVDIRTKAVDVPEQDAITKDNVSIRINAVIYYKIFDASKAILEVENFYYAVSQLAQTTMRNAVGEVSLDELLSEREKEAVITKARGEVEASQNLKKAAENLAQNPVAVHLRTLETINDLSSDQSNTIIFALPLDILKSFDTFNKKNGNN